jgi:hypothetical protein
MSDIGFWIVQMPGWVLFFYLVIAQCIPALNYSLGVKMGTQEPAGQVTEVGMAFFKGFAGADLVFYAPLLCIGLAGHFRDAAWGDLILGAALGITIYWPIVCLWAVMAARDAPGWNLPKEAQYRVVLPAVSLWGVVAMAALLLS